MASYTTHYQAKYRDGSPDFRHGAPTTRAKAIEQACALSRTTGGYVIVQRGGLEVASCYKGAQVSGRGASSKRKYGDQRACSRCGTDVEWHGRVHGWLDRGSGTTCGPYQKRPGGEFTYPKGKKHIVEGE